MMVLTRRRSFHWADAPEGLIIRMKPIPLTTLVLALSLAVPGFAQKRDSAAAPPAPPAKSSLASAYYHAALGHLYAELAE